MSSNLLQEAVLRAAHQHGASSSTTGSDSSAFSTRELRSSLPTSDGEDSDAVVLTAVHTPAGTPAASRSTSPTRSPGPSGRVGARAKREAAAREKASSWDPLRRLPNELSVRVFELVGLGPDGTGGDGGDPFSGVRDLLACRRVCQRWHRSATINYIWYRLSHLSTFEATSDLYSPPVWSRRDAKRDWSAHYRRINRRDDLETPDAEDAERARSGYQTPKEEKEARWRDEAESAESGPSKQEARNYYKELGGRKARGKTGKAAARDRTGWEDSDDAYY